MMYLASQSPRRQELLHSLQVAFEVLPPGPEEDTEGLEIPLPQELGLDYVNRVTRAKLTVALERIATRKLPFLPTLCADTTVCVTQHHQEFILGKPDDASHALEILKLLNGRSHWVYTCLAMQVSLNSTPYVQIQASEVFFGDHPESTLQAYVATQEPMGKAGAYAIQGIGSCLIEKIHGSHSGVMGLPLFETSRLLRIANIPYTLSL